MNSSDKPPFSLYLVALRWDKADLDKTALQECKELPTQRSGKTWYAKYTAYTRRKYVFARVAVQSDIQPQIINAEGKCIPMVKASTNKGNFWIEKGKFKQKNTQSQYDSPSHGYAGNMEIKIGESTCHIDIEWSEYTEEELRTFYEELRIDTDQSARVLLNDKKSLVNYNMETEINLPWVAALERFLTSIERIQKNPHQTLEEHEELQPVGQSRPSNSAIRDFLVNGSPPKIRSIIHTPSLLCHENQYVATMVRTVARQRMKDLKYHIDTISKSPTYIRERQQRRNHIQTTHRKDSNITERDQYLRTEETKIEQLQKNSERFSAQKTKLESLLVRLRKAKEWFCKHGLTKDIPFPGTVTFIHNIEYRNSYQYFQIIRRDECEEFLFPALSIDRLAVHKLWQLYEYWCLLQIILVLRDRFLFIPDDDDWKERLKMTPKNDAFEMTLSREFGNYKLTATLTYQDKEYIKGRIPDFVLRIARKDKNITRETAIVLDSKCKDYKSMRIGLFDDIMEIVNEKDYWDSGKGFAFVLHPCQDCLKTSGVQPQPEWRNSSTYCSNGFLELPKRPKNKAELPEHRCGGVLLKPPISNPQVHDNLQRLIGMVLDIGFWNEGHDYWPYPHVPFCLICGSDKIAKDKNSSSRNTVVYTCKSCNAVLRYTSCHKCRFPLFKRGPYWTYHSTDPQDPFNVICPRCETCL